MRVIQFGGVIFPEFNASQQLPVSFRSSIVPLRGGGFDQDGVNSYLEAKQLNLSFQVSGVDTDSIDDFINSLYSEADKGRRILVAKLRDGVTLWQAEGKLLQATTTPDARTYMPDALGDNMGYERMQLSFEIPYPYWLAAEDSERFLDEGWFMNSGITLDSGVGFELTTNEQENFFTITNNGGVKHQNSELVIEALTGATIEDVLVENTTTGEELAWEGIIEEGDSLVIKTLPQTIRLNGNDEYSQTTLPDEQVGFWKLPLGDNDFTVAFGSLSGGDAKITYKFARHYIR